MIAAMVEYGNGVSQVSGQAGGGSGGGHPVDVGANVGHMVHDAMTTIAAQPPHILIIGAVAILFGLMILRRAF
jgi:hypothetical protein